MGQIKLADNLPTLQNTVFGWVVAGKVNQEEKTTHVMCEAFSDDEEHIQELIERFWKLDELDHAQRTLTAAEKRCKTHFAQHNTKSSEGQLIVRLPLVANPSILGDSRQMAVNRFLALERLLSKNTVVKAQYIEFIKEYKSLGHMSRSDPSNLFPAHYFVPHYYVLKRYYILSSV